MQSVEDLDRCGALREHALKAEVNAPLGNESDNGAALGVVGDGLLLARYLGGVDVG